MPSHTPEERAKNKKLTFGERLNRGLLRATGADRVQAGLAGEEDPRDTRAGARLGRKLEGKTPSLSPRRRPENQTQGIFDEGKFLSNERKKKQRGAAEALLER